MSRIKKTLPIALFLFTLSAAAAAQGSYTAASCNYSDVNAVISGPTHTAVDGDIINIPAGSCTWTTPITPPAGIGITIIGTGTPNSGAGTTGASSSCLQTIITDNSTSSNLIQLRPGLSASLSRISCMDIRTDNAAVIYAPFTAAGTCDSSGCPNVRIDNITYDSSLSGINGTEDSGSCNVVDNVFGVVDHNSSSVRGCEFLSFNHSAWKGVGAYGDNSWASPDSFGTNQAIYLENNSFTTSGYLSESEANTHFGGRGGRPSGCQVQQLQRSLSHGGSRYGLKRTV